MRETSTQRASREFAEAVFADPAVRSRFDRAIENTGNREPVPDDFGWLAPDDEFAAFETLARKLVAVPKSELDAERAKDEAAKNR